MAVTELEQRPFYPIGRLCPLLFLLSAMLVGQANSQEQEKIAVGKTSKVVNEVNAVIVEEKRSLANEDLVYSNETITAELESHGEILLNDNTHILVGPGAEISLDEFVVAENGIESATINVLKGAFRFVSGDSDSGTFKIKTPLSTIGIRGTLFDVYVKDNGWTDVILFSGRVNVCTATNRCRLILRNCDVVRVTTERNIGFRRFLRSRNKRAENRDYALVANQNRFQEGWRAPIKECDSRAARQDLDERGEGNDPDVDPASGQTTGSSRGTKGTSP